MGILRPFSARQLVVHCTTVLAPTSTCAYGWILRVTLSEPRHHIFWSWGSRLSTHWMKFLSLETQKHKSDVWIQWVCARSFFREATVVRMITTRLEQDYSYKTYFEIWSGNQDFGRQNISISRPPLESTPIVTNKTTVAMSQLYYIPIIKKTPESTL